MSDLRLRCTKGGCDAVLTIPSGRFGHAAPVPLSYLLDQAVDAGWEPQYGDHGGWYGGLHCPWCAVGGLADEYHEALREVTDEIKSARGRFAPMHSAHEGYAVLLEEVDELWAEVKGNKPHLDEYPAAIRARAVQVAAMAVCMMVEPKR